MKASLLELQTIVLSGPGGREAYRVSQAAPSCECGAFEQIDYAVTGPQGGKSIIRIRTVHACKYAGEYRVAWQIVCNQAHSVTLLETA